MPFAGSPLCIRIPGPAIGDVQLSAFDCRFPGLFSRRVLVFHVYDHTAAEQLSDILTKALQYLVRKIPALGGIISKAAREHSPTGQDGWKTIIDGDGIHLHIRDIRDSIKYVDLEAANFEPSLLPDAELMPIGASLKTEPYDAAHFQLNLIDGGALLSCCISHVVADGTSLTEILRLLASYCKGVQEQEGSTLRTSLLQTSPSIGLDRSSMRGLTLESRPWSPNDNPAMFIRSPGTTYPLQRAHQAVVTKLYTIRADQLALLKQNAMGNSWISSNDAILSLIWRMLLINRIASGSMQYSAEEPAVLYFPVSAQRIPGLVDVGYIGNTVCNCVISHNKQGEVLSKANSLPKLATAIRAEINTVTRDRIASYCQFAESAPTVSDFTFKAVSSNASNSVTITSLFNVNSIYNSDWGKAFGHQLQRLRCTDASFVGIVGPFHFVLPKLLDGNCEIAVNLLVAGVEATEHDEVVRKYLHL